MALCECGCGTTVKEGNRFINGHNSRGIHFCHTEETKEKLRLAATNQWARMNPEERKEMKKVLRDVRKRPESRKKCSQGLLKYWKDLTPERREELCQINKEVSNRPEEKLKHRKITLDWWNSLTPKEQTEINLKRKITMNRPEVKEKVRKGLEEYYNKPGSREKASQKTKDWWASLTPEKRAELNLKHKIALNRPEVIEKNRKAHLGKHPTLEATEKNRKTNKKLWINYTPEERDHRLRISIYKGNRSPNISEAKLIPMLEPFGFHYNGRGPFSLNNKFPDYVHESLPFLIEFDGGGGHYLSNPRIPKNKPQLDDLRDSLYHKAGYNILRLYPKDLQSGKEHIQNKVRLWMEGNA